MSRHNSYLLTSSLSCRATMRAISCAMRLFCDDCSCLLLLILISISIRSWRWTFSCLARQHFRGLCCCCWPAGVLGLSTATLSGSTASIVSYSPPACGHFSWASGFCCADDNSYHVRPVRRRHASSELGSTDSNDVSMDCRRIAVSGFHLPFRHSRLRLVVSSRRSIADGRMLPSSFARLACAALLFGSRGIFPALRPIFDGVV